MEIGARLQEHGQVGMDQIAVQWAEREELPDQVLEAVLWITKNERAQIMARDRHNPDRDIGTQGW